MQIIPANDLKTKGVPVIEDSLALHDEAVISVRGKPRFVVMTLEAYDRLRELELDAALRQAKADIEAGDFVRESVADHIRRVTA